MVPPVATMGFEFSVFGSSEVSLSWDIPSLALSQRVAFLDSITLAGVGIGGLVL